VGPRACMNTVQSRKISCPFLESNPSSLVLAHRYLTAEISLLTTAIISDYIPPQILHAFRGRCLGLGTSYHLREARWKYPREAAAAGLCVGVAATLFLNGVVERLRSCEVGGRPTSGTASSTQFWHYQISFFPPTAEYNCTSGSCITRKLLRWKPTPGNTTYPAAK
jgi:hypothetical protein